MRVRRQVLQRGAASGDEVCDGGGFVRTQIIKQYDVTRPESGRESVLRPAPGAASRSARGFRVALIGNPNTGKTTLFNRLCGTRAKTSNFPGTTTSARVGRAVVGRDLAVEVVDLPGLYRLSLDLPEARIARDVLSGTGPYAQPDAVVVVVDACNLTRNLVLTGELLSYGLPVVVALNMVDLAQQRGLSLDPATLGAHLGCPVVAVCSRTVGTARHPSTGGMASH